MLDLIKLKCFVLKKRSSIVLFSKIPHIKTLMLKR